METPNQLRCPLCEVVSIEKEGAGFICRNPKCSITTFGDKWFNTPEPKKVVGMIAEARERPIDRWRREREG